MSVKSISALTIENAAVVTGQTAPETISPGTLGGILLQDIIDSMWNQVDHSFTLPPIDLTKAQLSTRIGAATLNDKQWIRIIDRNDGNFLFVCSQQTSRISPYGIWVVSGKPIAVIMDYVSGFEGETFPFFGYTDAAGIFTTATPLKIADGSQGVDKVLVSNFSGQTSWKLAASAMGAVQNPAAMTGSNMRMMGLNCPITPGKTGKVLVTVGGEYASDYILPVTRISLFTGTGAPPSNGSDIISPPGIVQRRLLSLLSPSATLRSNFSMSMIIPLTVGTLYWVDLGLANDGDGVVQIFNVTLTAMEQ